MFAPGLTAIKKRTYNLKLQQQETVSMNYMTMSKRHFPSISVTFGRSTTTPLNGCCWSKTFFLLFMLRVEERVCLNPVHSFLPQQIHPDI